MRSQTQIRSTAFGVAQWAAFGVGWGAGFFGLAIAVALAFQLFNG